FLIGSASVAGSGAKEAHLMAIVEGKAAPDFTLDDASGKRVSLKDFGGQNLILYFYPKAATAGCTKGACGFRAGWRELPKGGVRLKRLAGSGSALPPTPRPRIRSSSRSTGCPSRCLLIPTARR